MWALLEGVHGHVGVLAVAALLHPAILLRRGRKLSFGLKWAVGLSTAFTVAAFGLGIAIYPAYRSQVKRDLFAMNETAGLLFETKEHLAYGALGLALGACACALLAPPEARHLRKTAAWMYAAATLLALATAIVGTWVASVHTF